MQFFTDRTGMTNAFNSWVDSYITNTKQNLKRHCEKRLRWYLKIMMYRLNGHGELVYDGLDERNAIKYMCKSQDWTDGDELRKTKMDTLVELIRNIGWPGTMSMGQFVTFHWLEAIRMFAIIQREVEHFKSHEVAQWSAFSNMGNHVTTVPKPPKVRNFAVVPLCDYHLKHFVLDYWDLFKLMNANNWLPKVRSKKTGKMIKPDKNDYKNEKSNLWAMIFDIKKIDEVIGTKNKFRHQIVTDSVSVSIMFEPKEPKKTDSQPLDASIYSCVSQEVAIDPGMKTFLAGVVIDHETGVEVS